MQLSRFLQKAWTTNANTSSFASKVPTITEPTNDGVINLAADGILIPQKMIIHPYGVGADDDAFDMKIIGWSCIKSTTPQTNLWVPAPIATFTCTISTAVGVAGAPVLNTERFADTIVMKTAVTQPLYTNQNATPATEYSGSILIRSPADNTIGTIEMPLFGFQKLEFMFDQTTNTPTMNCLVRLL